MFIAYRGHADYVDVPAPLNLAAVPNGWPVKVPPETREALVHPGGAWEWMKRRISVRIYRVWWMMC